MIDNEDTKVLYYESPQGSKQRNKLKLFQKSFQRSKKVLDKRFPLW
jgi:hypothetical protein